MRIGVDLGGTKIEGIILSDDGSVAEKVRVDTPSDNYSETVVALCKVTQQLQTFSSERLTVGVGTPGALSMPAGVMKNSNSICLNGQALKKDIEERLGHDIRMENDANCFALSEACYGSAKTVATVFGVIIGTGTGGGIVINRRLLTGANSIAGEWGHNCVPASVRELFDADRRCYCGRSNCIETVLSGRGLTQTYQEREGKQVEAKQIALMAERGEQTARDCIGVYCQQLARCLASIVNVIDPDMIVLGGGLSNIDELYRSVPDLMKDHVFTDTMLTQLAAPSFGDASGARGAACLWPLT
ncbi:MAG: ROK family protein [Proteobacteria bacterium]|nr:ROK family protein [Pseudomonadota bacterium]